MIADELFMTIPSHPRVRWNSRILFLLKVAYLDFFYSVLAMYILYIF